MRWASGRHKGRPFDPFAGMGGEHGKRWPVPVPSWHAGAKRGQIGRTSIVRTSFPTPMAAALSLSLPTGLVWHVEVFGPGTVRLRLTRAGQAWPEVPLVRYGVVGPEPGERPVPELEEMPAAWTVRLPDAVLRIAKSDGGLAWTDGAGRDLAATASAPQIGAGEAGGFRLEWALAEGERVFGLGDVTRERVEKRGVRAQIWVRNVRAYVPVPFVATSRGWGLWLNTSWRCTVDVGQRVPDRLVWSARRGPLDFCLVQGRDWRTLLARFTGATGRPCLLPRWAYGLTYLCNQQADARAVLEDAQAFRREGIPCDGIGLEPGWMEKRYDYSTKKAWHPERFYIPPWLPVPGGNAHTFLGALHRLGFKPGLWLCCDYDVTWEAERRAAARAATTEAGAVPAVGSAGVSAAGADPDDFEQDANIGHAPVWQDSVTVREEPWFRHLQPFVDRGVVAFKMDGARQVNEHPDRCWGNGLPDEAMHNLYPTLLNQQMHDDYAAHTGRRPMVFSSGGFTGIQRYAATWAGDTGGGPKPLVSMLNHAFVGHSNVSCDMDVFSPAGIHFGFLQAWAQLNNWAYWRQPWLLAEPERTMFRDYARLRYRLLPYLYSLAHEAHRSGWPMMRPTSLLYPDEPAYDGLLQQYFLGDFLLVGCFAHRVVLPTGGWFDYWTGERHEGPGAVDLPPPPERGGPLLVRAGAILPVAPDMAHSGQWDHGRVGLELWAGGDAEFRWCEDDGESLDYRAGGVTTTVVRLRDEGERVRCTLEAAEGSFAGMPSERTVRVELHGAGRTVEAMVDGRAVAIERKTGRRGTGVAVAVGQKFGAAARRVEVAFRRAE